jgi:hypothetical protein
MPQMIKITLRLFLFFVFSPELFVNKNKELYDSKTKNIAALILCKSPLVGVAIANVPTNASVVALHGNRQTPSPAMPAKEQIISSYMVYPL